VKPPKMTHERIRIRSLTLCTLMKLKMVGMHTNATLDKVCEYACPDLWLSCKMCMIYNGRTDIRGRRSSSSSDDSETSELCKWNELVF